MALIRRGVQCLAILTNLRTYSLLHGSHLPMIPSSSSLANKGGTNGIEGKTGGLMLKASQILDWCQRVFPNAFFYREQVRGNLESQVKIDGISGEGVTFTMNAK